ncbi:MAG TPA: serine/threonine-protein kinase, partial [Pirellulales bacterium]|nr:serine/threonine-protein kinase [Pirellulales bacterium]
NGVVHRDIKPANVLIAADGTPKLSDFGLAKELNAGDGRTSSSVVLGTPSYMAPEQARGERELGPACDIYALGALFYELVTGRPPHLAESALATLELLRTQEPVPPQRLAPRTPRDLETIVLACLEREPNRRYASAAQLAEDLRRFRAGEPVRARRTGPLRRAAKWARRKPAMAASLVFLALSIGAVIGAAVWVRSRGDAVPVAPVDRVGAARGLKRAYQAWQTGNVQEAQELLDAHAESGGIDMRGFAWRYLERLCGCVATLGEPARPARWACFSPDGRTVATAGDGRGVRLWNAEIFQPRVTLAEAAGVLNRVQFGADGRTLVTAGVNHQLREWDVATGSQRRQLKVELPNNGPWALSSDCELFAVLVPAGDSTNGERPIIIQESDTGNEIQRFAPHAGGTTCLAFSPDGRWLASGGEDRKIVARDLRGEQPPIELMHGNVPLVVTFAPTEFLVLSGERDGAVTLWDVSAQTPNGFGSGGGAISALGFSADGSVRVAATCASTR